VQDGSMDIDEVKAYYNDKEDNTSNGEDDTIYYEASTNLLEEYSNESERRGNVVEKLMNNTIVITPSMSTYITEIIKNKKMF